jgi:hypothetical protein
MTDDSLEANQSGEHPPHSIRKGDLMTDDPLATRLRQLYCAYCFGTGIMDLFVEHQSREPLAVP